MIDFMIVNIKYNINALCKKVLKDQMEKLDMHYDFLGATEICLPDDTRPEKLRQLETGLREYGCEIVEDNKNILVQKIKDILIEMIYSEDKQPTAKISVLLSDKLNYKYGYLSNVFSDVTYSTIENFILLQKTERAKQLLIHSDFNLSEIAWKLNYSSLGHFSSQFKKVTGLTPSAFKRIIEKRRETKELIQIE
jgi:AraC-like DNA-binding protein